MANMIQKSIFLEPYRAFSPDAFLWLIPYESNWKEQINWKLGGIIEKIQQCFVDKKNALLPCHGKLSTEFIVLLSENSPSLNEINHIWTSLNPEKNKKIRLFSLNKTVEEVDLFFKNQSQFISIIQ